MRKIFGVFEANCIWRELNLTKRKYSHVLHHIHYVSERPPHARPHGMNNMELHVLESCVRGFHVYKDMWTAVTGEVLSCEMKDGNLFDPYAVAI